MGSWTPTRQRGQHEQHKHQPARHSIVPWSPAATCSRVMGPMRAQERLSLVYHHLPLTLPKYG
jgi:predicted RNA binding protein YcfA (HicA-like mRNA interferase family)